MNGFSDLPATYWISLDYDVAKMTRSVLLAVAPAAGNLMFRKQDKMKALTILMGLLLTAMIIFESAPVAKIPFEYYTNQDGVLFIYYDGKEWVFQQ